VRFPINPTVLRASPALGGRFVLALALASSDAWAQVVPRPAPPPTPRPIVLVHANVIDGVSEAPIRDATVVLAAGRIERVGRGAAVPPGAAVIDVAGGWVLPGLVDAHAHIETLDGARRALESGVTTVRSAGVSAYQDVALRELSRAGQIAGPDFLAAGTYVTPDLGETVLSDPRLATLHGGVNTPEELRLLVRVNLDRGVDVIKTRGTERAGLATTDPRKQVYTEAQLRVIVEAASSRGVPVEAHAHGDEGAYAAARAGVRSIEHGTYLSDSTLALMRRQGTYLVPTLSTMFGLLTDAEPVLRLRGPHMVPRLQAMVRKAHAMGIKIVTGSDANYGPTSTERISEEVMRLADVGLSPMEAIRCATTVPAELLGVRDRTGAIRPGLEADLIVVPANPLEDIRALQDVVVVISNGRVGLNRLPFGKRAR
jgi:imidazolonepropionase-like amidohydrolase